MAAWWLGLSATHQPLVLGFPRTCKRWNFQGGKPRINQMLHFNQNQAFCQHLFCRQPPSPQDLALEPVFPSVFGNIAHLLPGWVACHIFQKQPHLCHLWCYPWLSILKAPRIFIHALQLPCSCSSPFLGFLEHGTYYFIAALIINHFHLVTEMPNIYFLLLNVTLMLLCLQTYVLWAGIQPSTTNILKGCLVYFLSSVIFVHTEASLSSVRVQMSHCSASTVNVEWFLSA